MRTLYTPHRCGGVKDCHRPRACLRWQSFWTLTANPDAVHSPVVARSAARRHVQPEQVRVRIVRALCMCILCAHCVCAFLVQCERVRAGAPLACTLGWQLCNALLCRAPACTACTACRVVHFSLR